MKLTRLLFGVVASVLAFQGLVVKADPYASTAIQAVPPNISAQGSKPMVMMVASKDHTLFSPIYTDFEDLDGDGIIDVTFKPDFKYYGYFDPTKCYSYASGRFDPAALATETVDHRWTCSSGSSYWSGNFLNWATMTRLDVVRKMLYGGKRSTDTDTSTVLERANLSKDSHSFVKYYRGTDIRDYTPFTTAALTKSTGDNANVYAGLSICNRSDSMSDGGNPVIRLAKGNYRMWATVEGVVCEWGSGTLGAKLARYYLDADKGNGGIRHESSAPTSSTDGATYGSIGPELTVRVSACVSGLIGTENCQAYGSNYKPRGLFQEFGIPTTSGGAAKSEFGLISGSYDNNLKAGALRKNMADLTDEVNPTTGRFCHISGSGCSATTPDGRATGVGSIKALDSIVLMGRNSSNYDGSNVQLPAEMTNGTLPAWGNPIGEMIIQAYQYFSAQTSTNPTSNTNDTAKGLPVATWADPLDNTNTTRKGLYGNAICRSLNVLALSSSALSFDGDDADTPFNTLPNRSRGSLSAFTDAIGAAESINGTVKSVGSVSGGFGEDCSAKTIGSLSGVSGICPEAPGIGGTYKVAGAALYANTNRVRTFGTLPSDLPAQALKIKTYAASLTGGVARIEVPIPGTTPRRYIYITPESLWASSSNTKRMPGAMLTFASISSSSTHGAFLVTWNDSLFGGDYDMDIAGFLRYDIVTNASSPTGYDVRITTDIVNVGAGWTGTHGFSVIGTGVGTDGRYLTHRHLTTDSILTGAPGHLCGDSTYRTANADACNVSTAWNAVANRDSPIVKQFNMVGAESVTLREPLWYAAKYGSFASTSDSTDLPNSDRLKWDARRNDGKACGGATGLTCYDGEPDGYFLARRPDLLEKQLRDTFEQIVTTTNAAPAISSAQLISGSYKYVAQFEPSQSSGSVLAYQLDAAGNFPITPSWDAGERLAQTDWTTRNVMTNDGVTGKRFLFATSFTSAFWTALKGSGAGALSDDSASELFNYVRGDRSKEGSAGSWRARSVSNILGTVVNSSPWLQAPPSARILDGSLASGMPSYSSFALANKARPKLLWVGSNDGMLHAFKADGAEGGAPVISYVPSPLVASLKTFATTGTINAGMDGSPFTGDVLVGTSTRSWKTYLFSSLGRGGRAVFALDVTDTSATNLSETNASSIFKWMFTADDDSDLGYVLGDQVAHPTSNQATSVVRLNNGESAVLVPNGVTSTGGKAVVFILPVNGPDAGGSWASRYYKLVTDGTSGSGMVGVSWVDLDNNGTADRLYATDVKGRVWKFDISDSNPANWGSAILTGTTPSPFFEAKDGVTLLPITTSPVVSFPPIGGVMVSFGTGKSITTGDFPDTTHVERFYSIWDSGLAGRALAPSDLSTLVQRELTRAADGSLYVSGSTAAINFANKDGWYFNFPTSSEMLLSTPEYRAESLAFTTVRPPAAGSTKCFDTPQGSLYVLDPVSGLARGPAIGTITVSDGAGGTKTVNKVGADSGDQKVRFAVDASGRVTGSGSGAGSTPGVCPAGYSSLRVVGKNSDLNLCFSQGTARIQWREIPGLRTQ